MPVTLTDEQLSQAGLTAGEARVEIACRFFEAGRLTLWGACAWADLPRVRMEEELLRRSIALYRPTPDDVEGEMATLERTASEAC